jgi:hypothetical protein
MSFLFINIYGCASGVKTEKSAFDNGDVITMAPKPVEGDLYIMSVSLASTPSIPKKHSLVTLVLRGDYKIAKDTAINIKVGKEIFKFKPLDADKTTSIEGRMEQYYTGHHTQTSTYSVSVDRLKLLFYIPDDLINKISKVSFSNKGYIMVNLANNARVEEEINPLSLPSSFREFYEAKYRQK